MSRHATINDSIHALGETLLRCFDQLNLTLSPERFESILLLIYYALKPQGRFFHSIRHALELTREDHPTLSLAALFHDIVYYQIDEGFSPEIEQLLSPYIEEKRTSPSSLGTVSLCPHSPNDPLIKLNFTLFNVQPGQTLSVFGGLNELLSSLVMTLTFRDLLSFKQLAQMVTYIEGTIPFRGPTPEGQPPFEVLAERLTQANEQLNIGLTPQELDETVRNAALLANQDVLNFSEHDVRDFLANTWDLIPETNMSLRHKGLYSIQEYRIALQKMSGFFSFLNPNHIFHQYKGSPSDERLAELTAHAQKNMSIARDYLKVKLVSMATLEAFALSTGGDAPISLFMGELPAPGEEMKRLEDLLPTLDVVAPERVDPELWRLLDQGRNRESHFDLKRAPLSLFIYAQCLPHELNVLEVLSHQMFKGETSPQALLNALPAHLYEILAEGLTQMVISRSVLLRALKQV